MMTGMDRHANDLDPFRIGDYTLDAIPTEREAAAMRRLRDGDRIVVSRSGKGFVWETGPGSIRKYLVEALIDNQWVSAPCPDGPLFGEPSDGCLNLRGSWALRRHEER
jgi:hypothetical protein